MMSDIAKLSISSSEDVELAHVAGEIDASNADSLSEQLLDAMPNQARALVIDLTDTSYIDSSGISLIFDAAARLRTRRQTLRLVVTPGSFVAEVLAAVSLADDVPIDPGMPAALEALRPS